MLFGNIPNTSLRPFQALLKGKAESTIWNMFSQNTSGSCLIPHVPNSVELDESQLKYFRRTREQCLWMT